MHCNALERSKTRKQFSTPNRIYSGAKWININNKLLALRYNNEVSSVALNTTVSCIPINEEEKNSKIYLVYYLR